MPAARLGRMRHERVLLDESIRRAERKLKWHKAQGHSGSMRTRRRKAAPRSHAAKLRRSRGIR